MDRKPAKLVRTSVHLEEMQDMRHSENPHIQFPVLVGFGQLAHLLQRLASP